jgi:hypothetical protein
VWEEDGSRGGGYLADAFDGEGWLTQTEDEERGRGFGVTVRLGFAQRSNAMLAEVERFLKEAESANTPLVLGPDHPLSQQAFTNQQ